LELEVRLVLLSGGSQEVFTRRRDSLLEGEWGSNVNKCPQIARVDEAYDYRLALALMQSGSVLCSCVQKPLRRRGDTASAFVVKALVDRKRLLKNARW
jgi:hypothetical protein